MRRGRSELPRPGIIRNEHIDQIKEFIMVNGYDDIDKICSSSLKKAVETKNTKQYQLRNSVG